MAYDSKQIEGKPTIGFMSKVNISLFLFDFNNTSFVYLFDIILPSLSNINLFLVLTTN